MLPRPDRDCPRLSPKRAWLEPAPVVLCTRIVFRVQDCARVQPEVLTLELLRSSFAGFAMSVALWSHMLPAGWMASMSLVLALACIPYSAVAADVPQSIRVKQAVQPVLDEMSVKYNMSFSFGYVDRSGRAAAASGLDNIFKKTPLMPETLVPLGSVTKSWTAVMVMQAAESGKLSLDDPVSQWTNPVMSRLWNVTMSQLWGAEVEQVRVRDLLGMTSGFHDYDDFFLEHFTLAFSADDAGPLIYIRSSAKQGFLCKPRTCASYSGANYVLLGLVLVQVHGTWSWQDLHQLSVIPQKLYDTGRYSHTSFLNLGRCSQYPGIAHQYTWQYWKNASGTQVFQDLYFNSCLNGWTMGNIASSAQDLATFFFDLFTLPAEEGGFLKNASLLEMQKMKRLTDDWCEGPTGYGSCSYGMGILTDARTKLGGEQNKLQVWG